LNGIGIPKLRRGSPGANDWRGIPSCLGPRVGHAELINNPWADVHTSEKLDVLAGPISNGLQGHETVRRVGRNPGLFRSVIEET